jgi:hypothetical protein
MNNTKTTLALVAVLMAATLVVGTIAATAITTQTAFAAPQKKPGHADKKTRDNGSGNGNGNTVTIEECKNRGSASGFDTAVDQECENLICTHPGENTTCTEEGVTSTPTPTTIQVSGQGEGENFCPGMFARPIPASITFSVQQSENAATQGQFEIAVQPPFGSGFTKTGTLDSVQITGNSFTITGKELSAGNEISRCEDIVVPPTATITGQCGTGVTIQFATADGEHATFTGNVICT